MCIRGNSGREDIKKTALHGSAVFMLSTTGPLQTHIRQCFDFVSVDAFHVVENGGSMCDGGEIRFVQVGIMACRDCVWYFNRFKINAR